MTVNKIESMMLDGKSSKSSQKLRNGDFEVERLNGVNNDVQPGSCSAHSGRRLSSHVPLMLKNDSSTPSSKADSPSSQTIMVVLETSALSKNASSSSSGQRPALGENVTDHAHGDSWTTPYHDWFPPTISTASGKTHRESLNSFEYASFVAATIAILVILRFFYRILFKPLNRIMPHDSIGFDHLEESFGKKNSSKERAMLVNWVNRRKVIGDLPPVFPNGWFAILDSDSLPKEASRHVQALGENFAVFRDCEGQVHVLDAYCPHLGANLAIGGKVRGNCLECPFHGWKFDGDSGKCVSIPYSTSEPPPQAKVKSWPCKEQLGFIMVWYHAEGLEPYWELPEVAGLSNGGFSFCGRSEHYISTHIQDMPENGADVAHLNFLHQPGLTAGADLKYSDSASGTWMSHAWQAEWALGQQAHTTKIKVTHIAKLFNRRLRFMDIVSNITQTGPGVVILRFNSLFGLGHGVLIQTVTPVEPLMQKVVHRFYFSNPFLKFVGKFLLYAENVMFERDIAVWNSKKFVKNPLLVKEDKLISKYRRWYSQFYSDNSPTMESVIRKDSMDW